MPTSRHDFKKLAGERAREAKTLFKAQHWSGAYDLSGYAVECGLKSVLARQFTAGTFPDKKLFDSAYQHNLVKLVNAAGLQPSLAQAELADPQFAGYRGIAKEWSEVSRYELWTQSQAQDMVSAVTHQRHGVMKWIRTHW